MNYISSLTLSFLLLLLTPQGALGASFTFSNRCDYTIWPGILANAGSPKLESTGFELAEGSTRSFQAPTGWSGRFWARTGCTFDDSGSGSCRTGDCGSGLVECNGLGAAPPATLAEFTLGTGGQDFYDVSLVDGYNLPMVVEGSGGSGSCTTTGCITDLNQQCPAELKAVEGSACRSACEAFGSPEYCCSGAFNTPATCRPSVYSEMFKAACPRSYSYAYDDASSTFTCTGADYIVTFCPSSPSQKSASYSSTTPVNDGQTTGQEAGTGTEVSGSDGGGSGVEYSGTGSDIGSGIGAGSGGVGGGGGTGQGGQAMLADGSWLAGLAMGGSHRTAASSSFCGASMAVVVSSLLLVVSPFVNYL
ncbi:unnamed protein product [Linum trigynum]|uniref:Thaumatin-like protein 1b n=1 Tax=Linum trigynum TaxID=586398 RepID=A0AAV2ERE4_9ROSI